MPMPESMTESSTRGVAVSSFFTSTRMNPLSVNLMALLVRLMTIWLKARVSVGTTTSSSAHRLEVQLDWPRSEEHTSELQSPYDLVCRLLLEKKKKKKITKTNMIEYK